jgi:hypothetical protein
MQNASSDRSRNYTSWLVRLTLPSVTFPYVLRKGAIYEPVFWLLGPQASIYDQLGIAARSERGTPTLDRSPQRVPSN